MISRDRVAKERKRARLADRLGGTGRGGAGTRGSGGVGSTGGGTRVGSAGAHVLESGMAQDVGQARQHGIAQAAAVLPTVELPEPLPVYQRPPAPWNVLDTTRIIKTAQAALREPVLQQSLHGRRHPDLGRPHPTHTTEPHDPPGRQDDTASGSHPGTSHQAEA